MLPVKNRLQKKKDFDLVYRNGKSFYGQNITLKLVPNGLENTRVGVVVGVKFSKSAVERNRIKRQLREIMQLNLGKTKAGIDIVILVKKTEKEQRYQELDSILLGLLKKANIL